MKKLNIILLVIIASAGLSFAEDVKIDYNDHGKRDPFWSLVGESGTLLNFDNEYSLSDLNIEGIMMGKDGQNMAIVGGKIIKKGDMLGQYFVEDITKDKVVLSTAGKTYEVQMNKGE
ncbi:MAG: hypothetical protein HQL25_08250 [Candidatus Omnitrophica bacterium]|nr:hypothetical protein [Candidatus Omnitrophota bacterium]